MKSKLGAAGRTEQMTGAGRLLAALVVTLAPLWAQAAPTLWAPDPSGEISAFAANHNGFRHCIRPQEREFHPK